MKANPIIIIAILFAVAFAGRAFGIASAAANREDPQDASAPIGVSTAPPDAIANAASVMADNQATPETDPRNAVPAPVQASAPVSAAQRAAQNASLTDAIRARTEAVDAKEANLEERIRVLEAVENASTKSSSSCALVMKRWNSSSPTPTRRRKRTSPCWRACMSR